jgi:outer membrane protein TolC
MNRLHMLISTLIVTLTAGQAAAQAAKSAPLPAGSGAFQGAVPRGDLSPQPLALSFESAIERGLNYNLGLLLSDKATDQARAARLQQLSELLPQATASARETAQTTNLRALGISFADLPKTIGVANTDIRASVSAPLVDLHARSRLRAAAATVTAAEWDYRDARETVVLAIASAYLQTISAESAVASTQADLQSAQELSRVANARVEAGTSPALDGLRARVEMQTREQAVTQAQNVLDKQRLALLRILGLPLGQPMAITSRLPYKPLPDLGIDEALERALAARADYKSADAQVHAAELTVQAAERQRLPTVTLSGDYGALGTTPSNVLPTWSATAVVRASIFDGGRIRSDVQQAVATLGQRQAEREDLRAGVEQQVRDALLDVRAAAQQVDVATSTIDYARQALVHAQQRFEVGFASNLEVIQAQEALVAANTEYINALYAHNIAKLTLARAMGSAESDLKIILALETSRTSDR